MLGLKQTEGTFQAKGTAQDSTEAENALWQCTSYHLNYKTGSQAGTSGGGGGKSEPEYRKPRNVLKAQEWPEYKAENPFPKKLGLWNIFIFQTRSNVLSWGWDSSLKRKFI